MEQADTRAGNDEQNFSSPESGTPEKQSRLDWEKHTPQPTILTLQDLADLPKQILPEATYTHLKNACKETMLTWTSLFEGLGSTVNSVLGGRGTAARTRKHIDIE